MDTAVPAPQLNPLDAITGGDFAWYASTSSLSATTLVAVAATESALLTLFNAGEETQSVSLSSDATPEESISLEPGRFAVVSVVPGNVYQIDGALGIRAGVTYGGIGVVSATTVRAPSKLGSAILVYPR